MPAVTYWIDGGDRLVRVNDAWNRFAVENDASELVWPAVRGRRYTDFIADATTLQLYDHLMQIARSGKAVRFPIRCDGPTLRRRLECQLALEGGVVRCSSVLLHAEPRAPQAIWARHAPRTQPPVRACAWCKRLDVFDVWTEAEDAIPMLRIFDTGKPPMVTHGICPDCLERTLLGVQKE